MYILQAFMSLRSFDGTLFDPVVSFFLSAYRNQNSNVSKIYQIFLTDVSVKVPGYGTVIVDIAFGGAFYAIVHASQYNMDIKASMQKLRDAGGATSGNCQVKHKATRNNALQVSVETCHMFLLFM
jgi:hypothetical protein